MSGLREKKAERTRAAIFDRAVELFEQHGFDDTTMKQIADAADIGIATLYRYFPTKDSILLDPVLRNVGSIARHLDARPADEPIDLALGHTLQEILDEAEPATEYVLRLRKIVDAAAGPRAGLWETRAREHELLAEAIARRTASSTSELWVGLAAHTTIMVGEMALDLRRFTPNPAPAATYAATLLGLLGGTDAVLPRLP